MALDLDRDFFNPFLFLVNVIKPSKDIPNIMLWEVLLLRGPCGSPNVIRNTLKYANFNMVKNATPELNLESDLMVHLFLMGLSDSELLGLPKWQERPFSSHYH